MIFVIYIEPQKPKLGLKARKQKKGKTLEGRFICYYLSHLNFRSFLFNLETLWKDCNKTLIAVFRAKPASFHKCLWRQECMPKDQNLKDKRGKWRNQKWNLRFQRFGKKKKTLAAVSPNKLQNPSHGLGKCVFCALWWYDKRMIIIW